MKIVFHLESLFFYLESKGKLDEYLAIQKKACGSTEKFYSKMLSGAKSTNDVFPLDYFIGEWNLIRDEFHDLVMQEFGNG